MVHHCATLHHFSCDSGISFLVSQNLDTANQIKYAAAAATIYPMADFNSTFSKTTVLAKADSTKNVVDTGTPNLVSATSIIGATA